jgi:hypothetical protein
MELEQRVTGLEERQVAVERDIKEIKSQLNLATALGGATAYMAIKLILGG